MGFMFDTLGLHIQKESKVRARVEWKIGEQMFSYVGLKENYFSFPLPHLSDFFEANKFVADSVPDIVRITLCI